MKGRIRKNREKSQVLKSLTYLNKDKDRAKEEVINPRHLATTSPTGSRIMAMLKDNPNLTSRQIADSIGCDCELVSRWRRALKEEGSL